jgi:hypothetical protein
MSFLIKVVNYFLRSVFFLIVNRQTQLAFLSPQHHRLAFHTAHHIKWQLRLAAQRHLKKVLLDALLDGLAKLALYLKIPVGRTQSADALMRPLVVVILHPLADTFLSVLKTAELRTAQKLQEDRLPEPLDLAQRHRVVWLRFDVVDPVFLQLRLKPAGPAPRRVLTSVVRQHLLRWVILRGCPAVHLDHVLRRLAAKQIKARDISGIIVDIPDQKGVPASETKRKYVRLPELVRC